MTRAFVMFATVLLWLGSLAAPASASHYLLEDLQFLSDAERIALEGQGVMASEELLEKVATRKGRASLSKATGIALERMEALADKVDLLQIRGVGPSMVKLLQAAGVPHAAALARMDASALHVAVIEANGRTQISPKIPAIEMLSDWIRQAGRAPVKVRRR